jgi:DNA polymerase
MQVLSDDPNDFCFFDTETRALPGLADPRWGDITKTSTARYARSSRVIMFQYAIGEDEPAIWTAPNFEASMRWVDAPPKLLDFMARALRGEAWFVAFNSAFDRHACNHAMVAASKRTTMPVRIVLDAMAQASAANLPGRLDRAHKAVGGDGKTPAGKQLIELFCGADGGTPETHPREWAQFCEYGLQDIRAVRDVFLKTRPLWDWEWEQFWSSEVVNDRGLPIDRHFVERAAALAAEYGSVVNERVKEYTGGELWSVNQHVAMAQWVYDKLTDHAEAQVILTKKYREEDDVLVPDKVSLERKRVEKLIPYLEKVDAAQGLTDDEFAVLQLLETREYGASATPKKFAKMLPMLTDNDRLPGQYVFNGAQQTGRFSSRGVQVHNLTRKAFKDEEAAIGFICDTDPGPAAAGGAEEAEDDEDV